MRKRLAGIRVKEPRSAIKRLRVEPKAILTFAIKTAGALFFHKPDELLKSSAELIKETRLDPRKPEEVAQALLSVALTNTLGEIIENSINDGSLEPTQLSAGGLEPLAEREL